MALTSIIVHQIYRHLPDDAPGIQTRAEAFPLNGKLEELAYELKTQFIRKGGKSYGRFSEDIGEYPFAAWLGDYRNERTGFDRFSEKAMQQFQQLLEKAESTLDSYVFFVEESIEAGKYLYLFVVEHQTGLYLDSNLELTDSRYLDTADLSLAGAPVSREEFLPQATRFDAGVEGGLAWSLSDQADLGLSIGAQYVDARKEMTNAFAPIGLDAVRFEDPRWSIPVNLGVNFRF